MALEAGRVASLKWELSVVEVYLVNNSREWEGRKGGNKIRNTELVFRMRGIKRARIARIIYTRNLKHGRPSRARSNSGEWLNFTAMCMVTLVYGYLRGCTLCTHFASCLTVHSFPRLYRSKCLTLTRKIPRLHVRSKLRCTLPGQTLNDALGN